jgi:hypothetical protein
MRQQRRGAWDVHPQIVHAGDEGLAGLYHFAQVK